MIQINESQHDTIQRLVTSIRLLNRALYQLLREEADLLDSTVVQLLVLRILSKRPNIGLSELAEALQLGNSTMSGVVDRLVSGGLIVRERSASDRRLLTMKLTPEGEEKQKEAFDEGSFIMKRLSRILELSEQDLNDLFQLHEQILEKLGSEGDGTT